MNQSGVLDDGGAAEATKIPRSVAAIFLGVIVAFLFVGAIQRIGMRVYPFPAGLDPNDTEAFKAAVAKQPAGALVFVLVAWVVGTFVGAWTAARVAGRAPVTHGMVVAVLQMGSALSYMLVIPHPAWFFIAGTVVFLPSAYLGAKLAAPKVSPVSA